MESWVLFLQIWFLDNAVYWSACPHFQGTQRKRSSRYRARKKCRKVELRAPQSMESFFVKVQNAGHPGQRICPYRRWRNPFPLLNGHRTSDRITVPGQRNPKYSSLAEPQSRTCVCALFAQRMWNGIRRTHVKLRVCGSAEPRQSDSHVLVMTTSSDIPPVATRTLFRNHREPIVIRGKWAAAVSQPSGDWNFILPPVLRVEGQMKWSCRYACVAHTREDYDSGRHKSGYTFLEVCEWLKYFNSDSGR